jgi:hypothetical protein
MIGYYGNNHLAGTYIYSGSWFEAKIQPRPKRNTDSEDRSKAPASRGRVQHNVHGDSQYRTHVNIWSQQSLNIEISKPVRFLRPGDIVQLFAKAHVHWGWQNWVKSAEITVTGTVGPPLSDSNVEIREVSEGKAESG